MTIVEQTAEQIIEKLGESSQIVQDVATVAIVLKLLRDAQMEDGVWEDIISNLVLFLTAASEENTYRRVTQLFMKAFPNYNNLDPRTAAVLSGGLAEAYRLSIRTRKKHATVLCNLVDLLPCR